MAKIDKSKRKCNETRRTPGGPEKFVVKACQNGTEKMIDMATVICGLKSQTQSVASHFVQDINAARQKISSLLVIGHARIGDK